MTIKVMDQGQWPHNKKNQASVPGSKGQRRTEGRGRERLWLWLWLWLFF